MSRVTWVNNSYGLDFTKHKLYALYKCLYHWEFMAVKSQSAIRKLHFFNTRSKFPKIPACECYCCAYSELRSNLISVKGSGVRDCSICPLTGYAWYDISDEMYKVRGVRKGKVVLCIRKGPYHKWCRAVTLIEERKAALAMVAGIRRAIRDAELARI